jgi:hypothetical protein
MTDKEFLERLLKEARIYGWDGDYVEVRDFVRATFRRLGKVAPTIEAMEPFEDAS